MSEQPTKNKVKRIEDAGKPLIYTQSLMEIFDFDENAIRMNEQGYVTNRQKQKITDSLQEEADSMWLMLTIFLGVSVVLALIFSLQGYAPMPLVLGAGLLIGALLGISYFRQQRYTNDTKQTRSFRIEGMPSIRPTMAGDQQWILDIGEEQLPISYEQAAALSEFALPILRIYYTPNSKQILSAEVLEDAEIRKLKNDELLDDDQIQRYAERQLEDQQSTMQK